MNRGSFLWLLIACGIAALVLYHAFFPYDGYIVLARLTGLVAFGTLCVSLMIGPFAVLWPKEFLPIVESRRAIGLVAFAFMLAHFAIVIALELGFNFSFVLGNGALIVGAAALLLSLIITLTSSDWGVKSVPGWKNIQRLAYAVFALAFAHFVLVSNGLLSALLGNANLNLAEAAMAVLGLVTVAFQVAGFYIVKQRQGAARAAVMPVAQATNAAAEPKAK